MKLRQVAVYSALFLATACIKEELPEPNSSQSAMSAQRLESKEEVYRKLSYQEVSDALAQNSEVSAILKWDDITLNVLTNAVQQSGGVVMIGYKPASMTEGSLNANIHLQNMENAAWANARKELYQIVSSSLSSGFESVDVSKLVKYEDPSLPFLAMELSDFETIKALRGSNLVRYIEPANSIWDWDWQIVTDIICYAGTPTNYIWAEDTTHILPNAVMPWNYDKVEIPAAWEASAKGEGITIGLIDTGVPTNTLLHQSGFTSGWSGGRMVQHILTLPGGTLEDGCGHGTKMAGTIAGPRNSQGATTGVAYKANLNIYKGVEDVWINTLNEQVGVIVALDHAVRNGVRVMSMSLGSPWEVRAIKDAIIAATNQDLMVICAAGTSPPPGSSAWVAFPASMPETIAVTGIIADQAQQQRCDYCHAGPEVDFTIPMQRLNNSDRLSLTLRGDSNIPQYVGGSSIATATVAGIAAMVFSQDPSQTSQEVFDRLRASATYPNGKVGEYGYGTINAYEAVVEEVNCNNLLPNGDFEQGITFSYTNHEQVSTYDMQGYRKLQVDSSFADWAINPGCIPEIGSGKKLMVMGTSYESNLAYFLASALNEEVLAGETYQISLDFSGGKWRPDLQQYEPYGPGFTLQFYSTEHGYSKSFDFSADPCSGTFIFENVFINHYGASSYNRVRMFTANNSYGSIFQIDNLSICHVE